MKTRLVLLGAEGCSEINIDDPALRPSWIRPATEEEVATFKAGYQVGRSAIDKTYDGLWIDATGRPYFPVVISQDGCPEFVWSHACHCIRTVRLD
jgi:hypothetical protein